MNTIIYSILHMFVDGICAFTMFGRFVNGNQGYEYFLIYNFCAFALQMPFGAILDSLALSRKQNDARTCAWIGVMLTILGAWTHPIILGIGNALFHVGAGVCVIREDDANGWQGQALGVFVAPGALGLFIGTQVSKGMKIGFLILLTCLSIVMLTFLKNRKKGIQVSSEYEKSKGKYGLLISCFLVVVLRSYVGMAVTFSWKTTAFASTIAVLAVVFGKMAGGVLAAKIGTKRTIVLSLSLAAVSYLLSDYMAMGILALFLFNMTMPITLYLLVKKWRNLPGFSFGLLTFGLFLGFLPIYFGVQVPVSGYVIGAVGSLLSIVLLLAGKGWWAE